MKRRTFALGLSSAAAGIALDMAKPGRWMQSLARELHSATHPANDRILVVVQLSGGNDGLNTVVPVRDEAYARARPKLKLDAGSLVTWSNELGLHPSLKSLDAVASDRRMCILQGVGYESPNRSHFESMDIWHSCFEKKDRKGSGWLGRFLAGTSRDGESDAPGLHVGPEPLPMAMMERSVSIPSLASIEQMRLREPAKASLTSMEAADRMDASEDLLGFLSTSTEAALAASRRLESALATPDASGDFPDTPLGERLKTVSRLILSGLSTRIYYVMLDGFDTHANQPDAHAGLLRQWSDAVAAFCGSMQRTGQQDRVLVMTFSEFGRRVAENASQGTDHGAAAPLFLHGPEFASPLIGAHPSLEDLIDGDLKYHTDFRDVYATVIEDWFQSSSLVALGENFIRRADPLPIFRG